MSRGYLQVNDEQVYSRQHMTGLPWWQWVGNADDMMSRCGCVASMWNHEIPCIAALNEVARFHWNAEPEEEGVNFRLWVSASTRITFNATTSDVALGNSATCASITLSLGNGLPDGNDGYSTGDAWKGRFRSIQMQYPRTTSNFRVFPSVPTPWYSVEHASTLPTLNRMLTIRVQDSTQVAGLNVYLYGVEAWGYRRDR